MRAVSPVMPGSGPIEVVLGKDQPEYAPLPAVYLDTPSRPMVTRWRPTAEEALMILEGADIVLTQLTFCHPFQPVHLQVTFPNDAPVLLED